MADDRSETRYSPTVLYPGWERAGVRVFDAAVVSNETEEHAGAVGRLAHRVGSRATGF